MAKERFPGPGPFFRATLQTHSTAELCELLQRGQIVQCGLIPWGSNYTFLAIIDAAQEHPMLGVYKPRRGEAPLWDFPDGTLYKRERAAFVLSEALGWHVVPPTVIRDGPNGVGTMQLYIHHRQEDADYFALREAHRQEVQKLALFDLIANNTDRKAGHCLRGEDGHVWGIDHGLTFHADPKLRTVIWDFGGETIPKRLVRDVQRIARELEQREGIELTLRDLIFPEEMEALRRRIAFILKNPEFPSLHSRRAVPWSYY
ncbi:MAG: SCO1664 family protein [Candidatus Tectimicrobiota bacterium]